MCRVYLDTAICVRKVNVWLLSTVEKLEKLFDENDTTLVCTTTFLHLVQCSTLGQETEVRVHREGDSAVAFSMHANRRLAHTSINS